jgi:CHAT domain-containing protein
VALQAMAQAMDADPLRALFLGEQATKPMVDGLNKAGRLGTARVLVFATHGLLARNATSPARAGVALQQPALVLTPPEQVSDDDDGLLSLEEIIQLHLGATEWVVLSACNTAADDGSGEGLSGLVRGFFFAGAPTLLVSHWSVDVRATAALMSAIFQRYGSRGELPRAEAVRHGILQMLSQAEGETAYFAHPYAWAPFFLIGEGLEKGFSPAQTKALSGDNEP